MLCASWELYAESLAVEGVKHLCAMCGSPDELPLVVQKELANHVRQSKHELKPLALANSGWCEVLTAHIQQVCSLINTPKAGPLTDLFHLFIGLPKLSDAWTAGPKALNDFVSVRGDIAHRGRDASYVPLSRLRGHLALVDELAKETDNAIRAHLKAVSPGNRQPWKIIA